MQESCVKNHQLRNIVYLKYIEKVLLKRPRDVSAISHQRKIFNKVAAGIDEEIQIEIKNLKEKLEL